MFREVVLGEEAKVHEISSCSGVNEYSGVNDFILSLSSIAGGGYKYTIDCMGRRRQGNFPS